MKHYMLKAIKYCRNKQKAKRDGKEFHAQTGKE